MKMRNDSLRRRPPRSRGPVVFSIHWDATLGHIVAGALCGLGALLLVAAVF